jgi:hypothetical protein
MLYLLCIPPLLASPVADGAHEKEKDVLMIAVRK